MGVFDLLVGRLERLAQVDVNIQDQTTPPVIAKFNQIQNSTILTVPTEIDKNTMTVNDPTGFIIGRYVVAFSNVTDRFYLGYITGVNGSIITLDTPLDSVLPVGTSVGSSITNMNINGSVNPQVFGLRGAYGEDSISTTFDCTRILFNCLASSQCDLSLFGNIPKLAKGLVLRRRDGTYNNIFNVKSNSDLAGVMYDFQIISSTNPVQGQDGFYGRLTFAGQNKMGVALRLEPGDDLELIIQDDFSLITSFEAIAEGHIVQYGNIPPNPVL